MGRLSRLIKGGDTAELFENGLGVTTLGHRPQANGHLLDIISGRAKDDQKPEQTVKNQMYIPNKLTVRDQTHTIPNKEIAMFGSLGMPEILLIVVVIAVLFGGKKLPELGKGLGQAIKNFKNAVNGVDEDKKEESKDEKDN